MFIRVETRQPLTLCIHVDFPSLSYEEHYSSNVATAWKKQYIDTVGSYYCVCFASSQFQTCSARKQSIMAGFPALKPAFTVQVSFLSMSGRNRLSMLTYICVPLGDHRLRFRRWYVVCGQHKEK